MKTQKFGIEIEMTGITRNEACYIVAKYFNSVVSKNADKYLTFDPLGRIWTVVYDGSISQATDTASIIDKDYCVELVSPICNYDDMKVIQDIVSILRSRRAVVNNLCGIHIHIDASIHNATSIKNLVNIIASKEDLIYKALKIKFERELQYCKKINSNFLERINQNSIANIQDIRSDWYNGYKQEEDLHNHRSRYHGLNLHSVFQKGTIEFRLFNSTLNVGEIKSYIQLSLAISNQALNQNPALSVKTFSDNEKYTFRTWLFRLGFIGKEFKKARFHLLKNLDGNLTLKKPEVAIEENARLTDEDENGFMIQM